MSFGSFFRELFHETGSTYNQATHRRRRVRGGYTDEDNIARLRRRDAKRLVQQDRAAKRRAAQTKLVRAKAQEVYDPHDDTPAANTHGHNVGKPSGQRRKANRPVKVRSGATGQVRMGARRRPGRRPTSEDEYLNALMEAEYGPALAELQRETERTRNVGENRALEIGDLYNRYVGDLGTSNAASAAEREKRLLQIQGLPAAFNVGMDESVRKDLAGYSDISADTARTLATVEGDYDRRMAESARMGGVFTQGQIRRGTDADVEELSAKRRDLLAQRGAKRTSTSMELKLANREFALKAAELSAAAEGMGLDSEKTRAEIAAMGASLGLDERKFGLEKAKTAADIAYTQAQTRKANKYKPGGGATKFPRKFSKLTPVDREALGTTVLKRLGQVEDQATIVRIINNSLKSMGYNVYQNKKVGRYAQQLYATYTGRPGDPKWWGI